jgi:hypothetical protein
MVDLDEVVGSFAQREPGDRVVLTKVLDEPRPAALLVEERGVVDRQVDAPADAVAPAGGGVRQGELRRLGRVRGGTPWAADAATSATTVTARSERDRFIG